MNDFDLESKLKAVHVPAKTDEYWENFPAQVRMQLPRSVSAERTPARRLPRWAWSSSLAMACVMTVLMLWPALHSVVKDERALQRDAARFPHQLHVLMADEHGMQGLVSEN